MGKPRVGLRLFLLLTALVSLVAAAFALQTKADYRVSALDHARQAHVARQRAKWLIDDIDFCKVQLARQNTAGEQARWKSRIREDQGDQAKTVAEAEHHERLAERLGRY